MKVIREKNSSGTGGPQNTGSDEHITRNLIFICLQNRATYELCCLKNEYSTKSFPDIKPAPGLGSSLHEKHPQDLKHVLSSTRLVMNKTLGNVRIMGYSLTS